MILFFLALPQMVVVVAESHPVPLTAMRLEAVAAMEVRQEQEVLTEMLEEQEAQPLLVVVVAAHQPQAQQVLAVLIGGMVMAVREVHLV